MEYVNNAQRNTAIGLERIRQARP